MECHLSCRHRTEHCKILSGWIVHRDEMFNWSRQGVYRSDARGLALVKRSFPPVPPNSATLNGQLTGYSILENAVDTIYLLCEYRNIASLCFKACGASRDDFGGPGSQQGRNVSFQPPWMPLIDVTEKIRQKFMTSRTNKQTRKESVQKLLSNKYLMS